MRSVPRRPQAESSPEVPVVKIKPWLLIAAAAASMTAPAQTASTSLTREMGITQNLGTKIPTDVKFLDETGRTVTFADYLGKRPLLVVPVFYKCQTGCALITSNLTQTLVSAAHPHGIKGMTSQGKPHPLTLGADLDVIMLSIDPRETPELAADKKAEIEGTMDGDPNFEGHWHFLTAKSLADIHRVTDALGVRYYFNPKTGIIRHPTCTVVVSPNGTISGYTIGADFVSKFLEDDLAIAARNQVGAKADQSFMFGCVMLDPATGKIRFVVENIVRAACVLTMLIMGAFFFFALRNERRANSAAGGRFSGA